MDMKIKLFNLFILFTLLVSCGDSGTSGQSGYLPAFPGAEGFGAKSEGGRGGKVVKVTTLNDSGAGSFRDAVEAPPKNYPNGAYEWESPESYQARVEASGHRIVIFEVSGFINLSSTLIISYPYTTIAGQTSPGGILVTGRTTVINTHDVIMQHMRFRVGSHNVADAETHDTFVVVGDRLGYYPQPAYSVIIDHCSFSWGIDEVFSTAYNAQDITLQWSIVSEGLSNAGHPKGEHSKGILVSGKDSPDTKISIHHNYIAHNRDRNPLISGPDPVLGDVVNNVVYNFYGSLAMGTQENGRVNWVHNYVRKGPDSNANNFEAYHIPEGGINAPLIYSEGNMGVNRLDQSAEQWSVGYMWYHQLLELTYRKSSPWPVPMIKRTEMSYAYALEILQKAGATKPVRDSVDARVVADFDAGTGKIIDNILFPDDFPVFENLSIPVDNDNDGMADSWEDAQGLDSSVDDSSLDHDGDGYTNIEEYLHYLSDY